MIHWICSVAEPYSKHATVETDFSKLFERRKNVYYCQVFIIYHVIYAVIANFGKQQKVYPEIMLREIWLKLISIVKK